MRPGTKSFMEYDPLDQEMSYQVYADLEFVSNRWENSADSAQHHRARSKLTTAPHRWPIQLANRDDLKPERYVLKPRRV